MLPEQESDAEKERRLRLFESEGVGTVRGIAAKKRTIGLRKKKKKMKKLPSERCGQSREKMALTKL